MFQVKCFSFKYIQNSYNVVRLCTFYTYVFFLKCYRSLTSILLFDSSANGLKVGVGSDYALQQMCSKYVAYTVYLHIHILLSISQNLITLEKRPVSFYSIVYQITCFFTFFHFKHSIHRLAFVILMKYVRKMGFLYNDIVCIKYATSFY